MEVNGRIQLYPMLRVALALAVGIIVGSQWGGRLPSMAWLLVVIGLIASTFLARRKPVLQTSLLLAAVLAFGIWDYVMYDETSEVRLPEGEATYEAVIVSEPQISGKVLRVDLLTTSTRRPISVKAAILRDTLTNRWACLKVGDGIVATSKLEKPANITTASDFNYALWLRHHGFAAQTFVFYDDWEIRQVSLSRLSYVQRTRIAALRLRHGLTTRLKSLDMQESSVALIAAMALGDKSMITSDAKAAYSISGGSHVLALSGLHLGILYAVLVLMTNSLIGRFRRKGELRRRWPDVASQLVALMAVWSYVILVGMPASVVRAATMLSVYGLTVMLNRNRLSLNALAVAAVVMLVINPYNLWDVGFQMSFMAVLGIVIVYPKRRLNWFLGMLMVSIAAQMGVAPLIMLYFHRFSTYFLLTNFIVVPCATCILYGAVLLLLLTPFAHAQALAAIVVSWIAGFMNDGVSWIASLPAASIDNIHVSWLQVTLIYVLEFCVYRIICITLRRR